MTPKEKAKELVSKFNFEHTGQTYILHQKVDESKRCALIAVDEILNSNPCCEDSDRGGNFQWASNEYYWQEVKQEIEKL
jgi:hypothetical protein